MWGELERNEWKKVSYGKMEGRWREKCSEKRKSKIDSNEKENHSRKKYLNYLKMVFLSLESMDTSWLICKVHKTLQ